MHLEVEQNEQLLYKLNFRFERRISNVKLVLLMLWASEEYLQILHHIFHILYVPKSPGSVFKSPPTITRSAF